MKKRLLAAFLSLVMVISLLPTAALATEGDIAELDIRNGSIVITSTGYTQGDAGEETSHTGSYVITQTDSQTALGNYIQVNGATVEITLKGVNLNGSSSETISGIGGSAFGPFFIYGNADVTLILDGENTLTSTVGAAGLEVYTGSTVTIKVPEEQNDTYGSLTAVGGAKEAAGIGSVEGRYAGTVNIESGTITAVGGGGYVSGIGPGRRTGMTAINISGGHIINQGNQPLGNSNTSHGSTTNISGGYIETGNVGGSAYSGTINLTISGGTIVTGKTPGIVVGDDTVLNITGGNIGDAYTGTIDGRTLTKLAFFNENGTPKAKTEVTVTEGEHKWTAITDDEGMVTTYLAADTNSVFAAIDGGESKTVNISDGLGVVGAECTCNENPGALTMTTPSQSLTVTNGTATLELEAVYTAADSCVLPDGFHGDYETNISFEITKVVKNGQYMVADQYAEIDDTTLTVYGETNQDPYTVYVRAVSGPEGNKVSSPEIAITVNTYVSEAATGELDISEGTITVTAGSEGDADKTVYTQNGTAVKTEDSGEEVTIMGSSDSNQILVEGGRPTIRLKNVSLTNASDSPFAVSGDGTAATVILEGENTLTSTHSNSPAFAVKPKSTVTIKVPDGKADTYGTLTATGTVQAAGIGGGRAVGGGAVNIESGTIIASAGAYASGIGPGRRTDMEAINISGGHVTVSGGCFLGQSNDNSYENCADTITISGGYINTNGIKGDSLTISGGNICDSYTGEIEGRTLTKLYFVETDGTPKANTEVTVKEGDDGTEWTALTDENGVVTTYLASTTDSLTIDGKPVSVQNGQALIGGTCSCIKFDDIDWNPGLPETVTLYQDEQTITVADAELVTTESCGMPIHPNLPAITYSLAVTTGEANTQVENESVGNYAMLENGILTLKKQNAPYTVTLTATAGEKSADCTVSVLAGTTNADQTVIDLSKGNVTISSGEDNSYTYTQGDGDTSNPASANILLTGNAANAVVTVNADNIKLGIAQDVTGNVWTIRAGENVTGISIDIETLAGKVRFGTVDSTMPELSYVSAAPKLKLNPDQGDIIFNADGSVTQGKFTITKLKNNEEIAIWGADPDAARTVTNNSGKPLSVELNGEDVTLPESGKSIIPQALRSNQNESNPTTKTYVFDNGNDTYTLIAVGEGDASAPALANEEQEKIKKALLDSDFSGTLGAGSFLFYADLSELHAEQFSNIAVYTSTLGHVYLGAGLTDLSWGNYCATTGFTVDPENPYFTTDEKGVLYSKDYSTLYVIPSRLRGDYTTHEACTTVNANATMMVALDSLTLGKNVSSVTGGSGSYVFFANNLKAINVEAGNAHFASKDGILYNKDMTTILACPRNVQLPDNTLEIPATVTAVEEYIFSSVNIQKLVIPEGASISGGRGLFRMMNLTEIQLLGSYGGTIAEGDGYRMDKLAKVTVADGFNFSGNTFDYSSMEWIKTAGITVTGGENTPYDGKAHSVTVSAADGLTVEYLQADGSWGSGVPSYTDAGTYTVEWRITKPADETCSFARELYSSRTFTITALEADESWFTLTAVKPDNPGEDFTPVKLNQPDAAPSLAGGYTVKYGDSADVPIEAGSYLVTVDISAKGYVKEPLTLGYYTILSTEQSSMKVLSFVTNGGTSIKPIIANASTDISEQKPANPTRDGYTFEGWYSDASLRNKVETFPTMMPGEHTTYYAKWSRVDYTITYKGMDNATHSNPTVYNVETPTFTLTAPVRPGYEFNGWMVDGSSVLQETVTIKKGSTGNKTFNATWKKATYNITYGQYLQQTAPATYNVETESITLTAPAERTGYTFLGWTVKNDTGVAFNISPGEDGSGTLSKAALSSLLGNITVSGMWLAEDVTLTLNANGGKFSNGSETLTINTKFDSSPSLETPTLSGYNFGGWYTDADCTQEFSGTVTGAVTLYAKWTAIPTDDDNGGSTGGSDSNPSYSPILDVSDGGTIKVSPRTPEEDEEVTITVDPDAGYELDELTVTDRNGREIDVTANRDGTYTFIQPRGRVTIEANFVRTGESGFYFIDVLESAYYYDAVYWAVDEGITNGTTATTFSPNNACTRAQMVTFLWRAAGEPEPETTVNPFTDVSESAYYYEAVLWAVEQGITNGTTATTFSPDATVTRAQTVTFLWRSAGSPAVSGSGFADVASDAYHAGAVAWAVSEGITNGTTTTTFSPSSSCTRAQIVTFLYRYMA